MPIRRYSVSALRALAMAVAGVCLAILAGCETFFSTGSIERQVDDIMESRSPLDLPEEPPTKELEMYRSLTVEPLIKGARLYRFYLNTGDIELLKAEAYSKGLDVSFSADVEPGWYWVLDKSGQWWALLNEMKKNVDAPLVTTAEGKTELSYVPSLTPAEELIGSVKERFPDLQCRQKNGAVVITNPPQDPKIAGNISYILEQNDRISEKLLEGGGQVYYVDAASPEEAGYIKRSLDAEILRDPLSAMYLTGALEAAGLDSASVERLKVGIVGVQVLVWDSVDDPTRRRREAILDSVNAYCRDFQKGLAELTEGVEHSAADFVPRWITQEIDLRPQSYTYEMKAKRPEDQKELLDALARIKGIAIGRSMDNTQQLVLYDELGTAQAAVNRLVDDRDFLGEHPQQDGKTVVYFYTVKSAGQADVAFNKKAYPYPTLKGLADALTAAVGAGTGIKVTPVERLNLLVINDSTNGSHKKDIEAVLRMLDKRTPMIGLNILITESFADITQDFTSQVGITAVPPYTTNPRPVSGSEFGHVIWGTRLLGAEARSPERAEMGVVFGVQTEHLKAYVDVLRSKGYSVDILRPYLQVANRAAATVLTQEEVPINVQLLVGSNIVNTIQYKIVVDSVSVRPTIYKDGYVGLSIHVETGDAAQPQGPVQAPIITKREIDISEVLVKEGQTLIIAGILSKRDFGVMRGGPWWLSDWPIVGTLFRSKDKEEIKREIIITITPTIIDTQQEMKGIAETLEELARAYYRLRPPEVAPVAAPSITAEERKLMEKKGVHAVVPERLAVQPPFDEEALMRELRRPGAEEPIVAPTVPEQKPARREYWFPSFGGRTERETPTYTPPPRERGSIFGEQLYRRPPPAPAPEVIKPVEPVAPVEPSGPLFPPREHQDEPVIGPAAPPVEAEPAPSENASPPVEPAPSGPSPQPETGPQAENEATAPAPEAPSAPEETPAAPLKKLVPKPQASSDPPAEETTANP